MTEREQAGITIEMLRRMITYLREEALRLRVMDVALLLEHAEEAVTTFAPAPVGEHARLRAGSESGRIEH